MKRKSFFEGKEEVSFLKVPGNGNKKRKNPQPRGKHKYICFYLNY